MNEVSDAQEFTMNFDKPILHRDKMEYYLGEDGPRGKYHPCEVCDEGIIVGIRSQQDPFPVLHEQYCLGCGQRYYFKDLGIWNAEQREESPQHS